MLPYTYSHILTERKRGRKRYNTHIFWRSSVARSSSQSFLATVCYYSRIWNAILIEEICGTLVKWTCLSNEVVLYKGYLKIYNATSDSFTHTHTHTEPKAFHLNTTHPLCTFRPSLLCLLIELVHPRIVEMHTQTHITDGAANKREGRGNKRWRHFK